MSASVAQKATMTREITARCPCGHTIVVDEPERGQCLYGTLADKMARHEPCNAITRQTPWKLKHGGPETATPEPIHQ